MATRAAGAIVEISNTIWNRTIFTEIGTNHTKAKPFHLLISSNNPGITSESPIKGIMYPVAIKAAIKLPSGGASIGIKFKNLFAPKTNNISPRSMRKTIVNFEFIIKSFSYLYVS